MNDFVCNACPITLKSVVVGRFIKIDDDWAKAQIWLDESWRACGKPDLDDPLSLFKNPNSPFEYRRQVYSGSHIAVNEAPRQCWFRWFQVPTELSDNDMRTVVGNLGFVDRMLA